MAWGKGAYAVLQMLVVAVLARLLAPSDFGVVSAALVVIGFSAIVSHLGLGPALVQRENLERRHVDTAFLSSVLMGVALGAAVWLGAPAAARFFKTPAVAPVLHALACVFPLSGLSVVAESLIKRELRFKWLANVEVITYAVGYGVVGISLAFAGLGVWALVWAQLTQALLRTVILVADRRPNVARTEWRAFGELMYFGGGYTVAKIANYLAVQGDNLVVGRFLGPHALGLYGRAYQLMSAPAYGFGTILDVVLFPAMSRVQSDAERLAAAYRRGVTLIALVVMPPSALCILLAPEVIRVVLGTQWTGVVAPFQILAFGMLFRTSYKISDSLARATGSVYRRAWRQILYAGLVVGAAWVGQRWGISGVAAGALAALTVNFLLMAQLSLDTAGITWSGFALAHLPAALLTAAIVPPAWVATWLTRHARLPALFVILSATLVAGIIGGTLVWRAPTRFLGADALWMLDKLRGMLPGSASRRAPAVPAPLAPQPSPMSDS